MWVATAAHVPGLMTDRLNILAVSPLPASPPRSGAQARVHGLLTSLASRHDVTAVVLVDDEYDLEEARTAMQRYCRRVVLLPNVKGGGGLHKRLRQARSLFSLASYERGRCSLPALRRTVDELLRAEPFDIVHVEFPYFAHLDLRVAPVGARKPAVVVDSHEIAFDLARQVAEAGATPLRRFYGALNTRKLRRDELTAYKEADWVCLCSRDDENRLHQLLPNTRTAVIPNAADVDSFAPRPSDPPADGRTVVFFGLLSTLPNIDGVTHLVRDIWPRIAAARPEARLKIVGGRAPPSLTAMSGPGIEFTGFVDDLRPHLASAAVVVVPLRVGGGTRLKVVEAMSMAKPIVSTSLGAEGIEAAPGREIEIADDPVTFGTRVCELLTDPERAAELGRAARRRAEEAYSWSVVGRDLETVYNKVLELTS